MNPSNNATPLEQINFDLLVSEKNHEGTKTSNFPIPATITKEIKAFQNVFRAANNTRITREDVLYKLLIGGVKGLRLEADRIRKSI